MKPLQPKSLIPEAKERRLLCWDIENRPAAYWYDGATTSQITAIGWKWNDEKLVHTLMLLPDGYWEGDDGILVPESLGYIIFKDVLCQAYLNYGHNIRRHDLPIFQAGLLRRGIPPLPELLTSDTLKDMPKRKDMSFSLENLAGYLNLQGDKYTMSQPMWEEANRLTPEGIKLARKRVSSDVLLQEKLRNKLIELGLLRSPRIWRP